MGMDSHPVVFVEAVLVSPRLLVWFVGVVGIHDSFAYCGSVGMSEAEFGTTLNCMLGLWVGLALGKLDVGNAWVSEWSVSERVSTEYDGR